MWANRGGLIVCQDRFLSFPMSVSTFVPMGLNKLSGTVRQDRRPLCRLTMEVQMLEEWHKGTAIGKGGEAVS